jgi:hypothetical protein
MTLNAELNQKAKAILIRELSPEDYARFLQQYGEGTGDYTRDRQQWLGEENSSALHSQAALLATNGSLPSPEVAKMLSKED